jgi:glucan biosynthesis protein
MREEFVGACGYWIWRRSHFRSIVYH